MHQGEWPWHVDFSGLQALVLTKVYDSTWAAKLLVRACKCLQHAGIRSCPLSQTSCLTSL